LEIELVSPLGTHLILDLYDCPADKLDSVEIVLQALRAAAEAGKSTLLSECHHRFDPHGVTAVGLLAESHISIHTWPEVGYAAIDFFACGEQARPRAAADVLRSMLGAQRHELRELTRGELPPSRPARVPAMADG
jgi:S-adenosylmethionine decarboxylase